MTVDVHSAPRKRRRKLRAEVPTRGTKGMINCDISFVRQSFFRASQADHGFKGRREELQGFACNYGYPYRPKDAFNATRGRFKTYNCNHGCTTFPRGTHASRPRWSSRTSTLAGTVAFRLPAIDGYYEELDYDSKEHRLRKRYEQAPTLQMSALQDNYRIPVKHDRSRAYED